MFSVIVPPVALWLLPIHVRAAILGGEVFFFCRTSRKLWEDAFDAVGLDLRERETGWGVYGKGTHISFSRLEVKKLQVGVALSGISPRAVAEAARQAVSQRADEMTRGGESGRGRHQVD